MCCIWCHVMPDFGGWSKHRTNSWLPKTVLSPIGADSMPGIGWCMLPRICSASGLGVVVLRCWRISHGGCGIMRSCTGRELDECRSCCQKLVVLRRMPRTMILSRITCVRTSVAIRYSALLISANHASAILYKVLYKLYILLILQQCD